MFGNHPRSTLFPYTTLFRSTADYSGHPVSEKVTLKFIEQKYERIEKEEEYNGYKYKTYDYILHERELGSTDITTDRKSTRLNSSHLGISYAVFCLKKKNKEE